MKKLKKLRLYADEDVPNILILEFKMAGLNIRDSKKDRRGHPDENVREAARKQERVLLTMDSDFWDDRKHPLKGSGILFLDMSPDQYENAVEALARVFVRFAKYWPNNWWSNMKVRAKAKSFEIKMITFDGKISIEKHS